tara:strand:- start:12541 stop:12888 length:348 start_codon:yes stop_codon:yes gene_type:complete
MATKDVLVKTIKEWIDHDNHIKTLQQQIKEHRNEKKSLTDNLLEIMKENEIDCFDINNGKIIYCKNKVKTPLNKKTLLETLEKYFEDRPDIDANEVGHFVLDNRKVEIKEIIRRK